MINSRKKNKKIYSLYFQTKYFLYCSSHVLQCYIFALFPTSAVVSKMSKNVNNFPSSWIAALTWSFSLCLLLCHLYRVSRIEKTEEDDRRKGRSCHACYSELRTQTAELGARQP